MDKFDFITELRAKLWSIPEDDAAASVEYYAEMIDDRMEEGLSEEEAVAAIGSVEEIAQSIVASAPASRPEPENTVKSRKLRWWEITLLALGSPVWLSLLIAAAAVIFAVWISLWSAVIALYAVTVSLGVSAIGCILASFFMIGSFAEMAVAWGAALVCAGLTIPLLLLSNLAARGLVKLTKLVLNAIFRRKEQAV